jgi:hypothetical protein
MILSARFYAFPLGFVLPAVAMLAGIGLESAHGDALSDNLAKWQRMRPAHYQFQSGKSCFCQPATYLVEAEGAVVTQAKLVFYSDPPQNPTLQSHSIDSAFARLKGLQDGNPYRLEVTYDREFGFPSRVYVDHIQNGADDEVSYAISHFKVFPPGLTLANDTVFTADMAGLPDERRRLRLTNSGDSTLYLNRVELSVAPTDTFSQQGVAVRFVVASPISSTPPIRPELRYGIPMTDTIEAVSNVSIAPGNDLVLIDFQIDPCFCLLKSGTKIKEGDTLTLMLRLDFSRGAPAERGDVRAYAYVRGIYRFTTAIAGAPAARKAGTRPFTGWRGGLWLDRDGAFAPNGRRVSAHPGYLHPVPIRP